jgi:hypothetical protein
MILEPSLVKNTSQLSLICLTKFPQLHTMYVFWSIITFNVIYLPVFLAMLLNLFNSSNLRRWKVMI